MQRKLHASTQNVIVNDITPHAKPLNSSLISRGKPLNSSLILFIYLYIVLYYYVIDA